MSRVFISYKSDEFDEACWVKDRLEESGVSCWMAPMSIQGGSSYAEEIPKAIRDCSIFVLILSEKVQESKWVPRELDQAINNGKVILPFMIVDCSLKDDFDFYLSNVQRYEAFRNKEAALKKLIEDIKKFLPVDVKEVETEIPSNEPSENKVEESVPNLVQPSPEKADEKATEEPHQIKSKEKKPKNKPKKVSGKIDGKKLKKSLIVLGCIALAVIVLFSAINIYDVSNTLWICDKEYKKDDTYLSFENVQVKNEDILNMEEMDNIDSITFKKCYLKGIDLNRIVKLVSYSITFDECSITNEDIANLNVENKEVSQICFDNNPQLTDLSVLKTYASSLEQLSFNNCAVSDISFVKDLINLECLNADNNGISDLSALSGCIKLTNLSLSKNSISSLDSIKELANITILNISKNQISDLAPLEKMIYLEELDASDNKLTDISGLKNVTQLRVVNLSNNQITDVSLLSKSSLKLNTVKVSNNKIEDISSLAVCNYVTEFIADNNALTKIYAVKTWGELSKISVANNQLVDVSALESCTKLSYVDLSDNKITSVDCLDFTRADVGGVYLNISNNEIASVKFSPFSCSELIMNGNPITDISFLKGFEYVEKVVVDYNEKMNFKELEDSNIFDFYVLNCPLDKQVYVSTILGTYSTYFTLDETT